MIKISMMVLGVLSLHPQPVRASIFTQSVIDSAVAVGLLDFANDLQNVPMEQAKAINFMALVVHEDSVTRNSSGILVRDRLLAQVRSLLTGGKEPNANGSLSGWTHGSIAQAFCLAKNTGFVWNQFTTLEKSKIDLLMKTMAVAGHFGFDDGNNFRTGMGNEGNFNKQSNPNYREGYVGVIVAASLYFGPDSLNRIFLNFDYASTMTQITGYGFTNILARWDRATLKPQWETLLENGGTDDFGGTGGGIRNDFTYKGVGLNNPFGLFKKLADYMYGVDDTGVGANAPWVQTSAVIDGLTVAGYDYSWTVGGSSPYLGRAGLCFEFHAVQGSSPNLTPRSSIEYAADGWNNSISTRATLQALGYWTGPAAEVADVSARMGVGSDDLLFKAQNGFAGYAGGAHKPVAYEADLNNRGYFYNKEIWLRFLKNAPVPDISRGMTVAGNKNLSIRLFDFLGRKVFHRKRF